MKHNKSKIIQKPKGGSPSQVSSQSNRTSRPSSSNKKMYQRKTNAIGESNEGCLEGGDVKDATPGKI